MHTMAFLRSITTPSVWRSAEGLVSISSIFLTMAGWICLLWGVWFVPPLSPALWLLAWAGLEGAFFVALLPGLQSGTPPVARAAIRSAQVGTTGRTLLWVALGSGLVLHSTWDLATPTGFSPLLAHILAILTALFAFPVAAEWGPYAAETSLAPGGTEQGLAEPVRAIARAAFSLRMVTLLAAGLVALLPFSLLPLAPWGGGMLLAVALLALVILLERRKGVWPRVSLPETLRVCWWRTLPLGIATVVYLMGYAWS